MLQEALCRAARTGPVPDQLLPGRLHRWATVVLAACAGVTAGLGMAFAGDHGPGRLDSALDHPFLSVPHEAPTRIIRVSEIGNEVPTFTATALLVLRA